MRIRMDPNDAWQRCTPARVFLSSCLCTRITSPLITGPSRGNVSRQLPETTLGKVQESLVTQHAVFQRGKTNSPQQSRANSPSVRRRWGPRREKTKRGGVSVCCWKCMDTSAEQSFFSSYKRHTLRAGKRAILCSHSVSGYRSCVSYFIRDYHNDNLLFPHDKKSHF